MSDWLTKLRTGLSRSSEKLGSSLGLVAATRLDDARLDQIEEALIGADLGPAVAGRVTTRLREERFGRDIDDAGVRSAVAAEIAATLAPVAKPLAVTVFPRPQVILVVGVNGSGKTTTIAKLAHRFVEQDYTVMLAAGDTFRAAATAQLKIWGERAGVEVIAGPEGGDAAGLAFNAFEQARAKGTDVLIIDTAGRLQNKAGLMDELAKVRRVLKKLSITAPHDTVLVLDATTGQNALNQVEVFRDIAGVTGLVMTKLDGTARGGVLVAAAERFGLPIHAIGVGEGMGDLRSFDPSEFASALAGVPAKMNK